MLRKAYDVLAKNSVFLTMIWQKNYPAEEHVSEIG